MNKVNSKQLGVIVFFLGLVFKISVLPSLLYEIAERTSVMSIVFLMLLEFSQLALIVFIISKGGMKGIKKLYGEKVYRLMCVPFLFSIGAKFFIYIDEIVVLTGEFIFYHSVQTPIILSVLLVVFYIGTKGFKAVARVFDICLWLIPVIALYALVFGDVQFKSVFLSPIFDEGFSPVVTSISRYVMYGFDFLPLLFIDYEKKKGTWIVLGSVLCVIFTVGIYLMFIASFGPYGGLNYSAFASLSAFNIVISQIGRLDWPSSVLWLSAAVLSLSFKACAVGEISDAFSIKPRYGLGAFCIAIGIIYLTVLNSRAKISTFATGWARLVVFAIEIIVPCTLLVMYAIKNGKATKNSGELVTSNE